MNPQQSVYPNAPSRLFSGNGEPSAAYPYPDHRSSPAVSGLRASRNAHEPVHHGGVKTKRTPKRFAPMHSSLHRPDFDIVTVPSPMSKPPYASADEQLSMTAPFSMPHSPSKHRFLPAATAVATGTTAAAAAAAVGVQSGQVGKPSDSHTHPHLHATAGFAPKSHPLHSPQPQPQSQPHPRPQPQPQSSPQPQPQHQPRAKATEPRNYVDLTEASDSDGPAPSRIQREPLRNQMVEKAVPTAPVKAHVHVPPVVFPMIVHSSHSAPTLAHMTSGSAAFNRATSHPIGNGTPHINMSSFLDQYRFMDKPGNNWIVDVAPYREPSIVSNQSLQQSPKLEAPGLPQDGFTNPPAVMDTIETFINGTHPLQPVRAATPRVTEVTTPSVGLESRPPPINPAKALQPATKHKAIEPVSLGEASNKRSALELSKGQINMEQDAGPLRVTQNEARLRSEPQQESRLQSEPQQELRWQSELEQKARPQSGPKPGARPPSEPKQEAMPLCGPKQEMRPPSEPEPEPERESSGAPDTRSTTQLVAEQDSTSHRSALLDAQIYSQDGARTPPPGVSLEYQDTGLFKAAYAPVYLHTNPRIHGMHHRSEAWAQQRAEEIRQRRRHRRWWFGKPSRRRNWLQARKAEAEARAAQRHGTSSYPPRKEPEPWTHQTPADFASMREEDLPSDVRDDPVWLKICARLAKDKAMRQDAMEKTVAAHKRDAEAKRKAEAEALARAREQHKEAARRQARTELSRQLEEVRKLSSPRAKPPMATRIP